ncbi:MAG: hypothetical protein Q8P67_27225, partial [archaeon]|nr:hypothetical protein [archaeon]
DNTNKNKKKRVSAEQKKRTKNSAEPIISKIYFSLFWIPFFFVKNKQTKHQQHEITLFELRCLWFDNLLACGKWRC